MNEITFYAPKAHIGLLTDLRKIPFAKTDSGYQFASWVYDLNDSEDKRQELLETPHGKEAVELLEKTKQELSELVIREDEYLDWSVHKKESGGIKKYHDIIYNLSVNLMLLSVDLEDVVDDKDLTKASHSKASDFYTVSLEQTNDVSKKVLNRNNPFSDVTIKSQQFFYKAGDGSTETLFFNTNNIVEKVDKNGKDMFTMRPSFSVTKEHGVVQQPMQKITFADSIAESIVGDEEHIYIHID